MDKVNAAKLFRESFSETSVKSTYDTKLLGSRSIGLDRVSAYAFASNHASEVSIISRKVLAATYRFTKFKEKLISKGASKYPRQLSIPTIRDRLTLRVIWDFLFKVFPESKPSLPQKKIAQLREVINSGNFKYFVKIDLRNFYPSISHKLLFSRLYKRVRVAQFHSLMKCALETPTVPESAITNAVSVTEGVAQGLSISNVLAEVFMLDVDEQIRDLSPFYLRFVDDIILLTNEEPRLLCQNVVNALKRAKLDPHPLDAEGSKTQIGEVSAGCAFLGYFLRPQTASVRPGSISSFEGSLVGVFTEYKYRLRRSTKDEERAATLAWLRWTLNLKLTGCNYKNERFGWVFYYSQINDLSSLRRIDHTVSMLLSRFDISTPPNPKRALKAFYESKRTDKGSHFYIPNFDQMSVEAMRQFLSQIGQSVQNMPDAEVGFLFHRLIHRATRSLEKDVA